MNTIYGIIWAVISLALGIWLSTFDSTILNSLKHLCFFFAGLCVWQICRPLFLYPYLRFLYLRQNIGNFRPDFEYSARNVWFRPKELQTIQEFHQAMELEQWTPNTHTIPDYRAYYDCGCGGQHVLSEGLYDYIAAAKAGLFGGFKFLLRCHEESYVTLVRAKGVFPTKIDQLWTCRGDLYEQWLMDQPD